MSRCIFKHVSRPQTRYFSSSTARCEIRHINELPERIYPKYTEARNKDLLCLQWPAPPRNILLSKKNGSREVTDSLLEYAQHIHSSYPSINIILEPQAAAELHAHVPFPVYTTDAEEKFNCTPLREKIDLISTLGGDGTILRASALFGYTDNVPPVLSFGMGTLGFLGEWKFSEYKRAFREVYMSGASDTYGGIDGTNPIPQISNTGWSSVRGKSMGNQRAARVLLRNRLKVGVFDPMGSPISTDVTAPGGADPSSGIYAMNEVVLHRGVSPHLAYIGIYIGGRFLTEAVADGLIVSSPTGSTAYSLSSGGSIVHPLVPSLLLTPICPRSLSFRPLVLPANSPITLRLSENNRGRELEVTVDGIRMEKGVSTGYEVRVVGEEVRPDKRPRGERQWSGGVPSVVRGTVGTEREGQDHWVGGLNALLKFNYPFGKEVDG